MYVDDSGSVSLRGGRYYFLSGIILHEQLLDEVNRQVQDFKDAFFVGELNGAELHVYDIFNRTGRFAGIDISTRNIILQELYGLINVLPITIICSGIDKDALYNYYKLLRFVWTFLVERFDKHILESIGNPRDRGLVLSDKNPYEREITMLVREVIRDGSKFQTIDHLIEAPLFVNSYDHQLIQIADACAYCTMKYYFSSPLFENYWYAIRNKMRKAPNGDIGGYGLKIFP
jgi:Protein of unknown function (DUF3800)